MKPIRMAAMLLILFLVIYPLSIGPAFLLDFELHAKEDNIEHPGDLQPSMAFLICYYPLYWVMDKCPSTIPAVSSYVRLWFPLVDRG